MELILLQIPSFKHALNANQNGNQDEHKMDYNDLKLKYSLFNNNYSKFGVIRRLERKNISVTFFHLERSEWAGLWERSARAQELLKVLHASRQAAFQGCV